MKVTIPNMPRLFTNMNVEDSLTTFLRNRLGAITGSAALVSMRTNIARRTTVAKTTAATCRTSIEE